LTSKSEIETLKIHLDISDTSKSKLLEIDLNSVTELTEKYSNADIVINSFQQISQLKKKTQNKNENAEEFFVKFKILRNCRKCLKIFKRH